MSEVVKKKDTDRLLANIGKSLDKAIAALEAVKELLDTELEIVETEE